MNTEHVDAVVHAVIYEGHILYPYRPSSMKNRRRFTFGRIYPRSYSEDQDGRERWTMTTECLLEADERGSELEVRVRFLHPVDRQVYRTQDRQPRFRPVPNLVVDGEAYHTWQEVEEQIVDLPAASLVDGHRDRVDIKTASFRERDDILQDGTVVGAVERRREEIAGAVEIEAHELDGRLFKITVRIRNETAVDDDVFGREECLLLRTMTSAHTILQVRGGRFLSMTDPPAPHAEKAAACRNDGTWPVLVGTPGQSDTMLSSPIILYDYPQIADESKGDLFDATEIDELLSLRIMTLTDEEKDEMRGVDEFARRILQRTESMSADDLLEMHGRLREWKDSADKPAPRIVQIGGAPGKIGDRVRLRPRRKADAMDMTLAGRIGQIESIEQTFEGDIYLAVVLDDDPGKDLGMMRQPGHRFFYSPDELELLERVP